MTEPAAENMAVQRRKLKPGFSLIPAEVLALFPKITARGAPMSNLVETRET